MSAPTITSPRVTTIGGIVTINRPVRIDRPSRRDGPLVGEPLRYEIPDAVGEHVLGTARYDCLPAVVGQDHGFVLERLEADAVTDLVDDEQVAPLAGQLRPPVFQNRPPIVARLGGEPDDDQPG